MYDVSSLWIYTTDKSWIRGCVLGLLHTIFHFPITPAHCVLHTLHATMKRVCRLLLLLPLAIFYLYYMFLHLYLVFSQHSCSLSLDWFSLPMIARMCWWCNWSNLPILSSQKITKKKETRLKLDAFIIQSSLFWKMFGVDEQGRKEGWQEKPRKTYENIHIVWIYFCFPRSVTHTHIASGLSEERAFCLWTMFHYSLAIQWNLLFMFKLLAATTYDFKLFVMPISVRHSIFIHSIFSTVGWGSVFSLAVLYFAIWKINRKLKTLRFISLLNYLS